jgi:UDP-GlcNAc:undecaprenyl-phosphate/decaprenyl-phosphate GlcNAc-1-phosphate transferase
MDQIIIAILIAFVITYVAIPSIIKVAIKKKLYDLPNERKVHKRPIPSLGGLGMFIGLILSLLLSVTLNTGNAYFQYYLAGILVIFFLGIKDDILIISPTKKFIGQMMVALLLSFKANLLITNMHGFLGLYQIDATASYLLTIFTMVVVINAFNLIDGVDGLAGSIGLITSFIFGFYFYMNGDTTHALLGLTMASSIAAFLFFNFQPAKIFMGDTGSMLIGLVNIILAIKFIENAPSMKFMPFSTSPVIGFAILAIPLLDTLRVFGIRLYNKRSPFNPDRNHLHHLLLDRGLSHRSIAISIAAASLVFIGFAYLLCTIAGTTLAIAAVVGLFFTAILALHLTRPQIHLRVVKGAAHEDEIIEVKKPGNIVAFFSNNIRKRKPAEIV